MKGRRRRRLDGLGGTGELHARTLPGYGSRKSKEDRAAAEGPVFEIHIRRKLPKPTVEGGSGA
eukprot:3746227-Prorocentrum_lima.AAC.1